MKINKKIAERAPDAITILWEEGVFKTWIEQERITGILTKRGINFIPDTLRKALGRSTHLISKKKEGVMEYIQKKPFVSKQVDAIQAELFENDLIKKLGTPFEQEILDLHLNFGKSGNCTAFILRKILEKLIFIAFSKNGFGEKIANKTIPTKIMGLEAMIETAAREKMNGVSFLTHKTAEEIKGIKFLGDTSAHNPLVNVDMKTIIPQMPYIITAYKELAEKL